MGSPVSMTPSGECNAIRNRLFYECDLTSGPHRVIELCDVDYCNFAYSALLKLPVTRC
jgi:hypothetical protein